MSADYREHLDLATACALEAGAFLRDEFSRPGGPLGSGGHAEADEPAERMIRDRLLDAFPEIAYLGEETGPGGPRGADHRWLVDPNDGTVAFLRGYRGAAVSIGLVREGIPVLGVVYAYAAPDHRGDLFTWAQGCGPLQRNGRAVVPPAWPGRLSGSCVVFAAQWANVAAQQIADRLAPARFRAMPSIAYRLALVAAGDGVGAVSMGAPVSWDYCGGHALLRAVGGDLVDQGGRPVRYDDDSRSTRFAFGGAPGAIDALAAAKWSTLGHHRFEPDELDLVILEHGSHVDDPGLLSRAQGCLLGQLAGDSLGSLVEFRSAADIGSEFPDGPRQLRDGGTHGTLAGQPTDDSEMALSLARTLVRDGGFDPDRVLASYRQWYRSKPFDIGNTTSRALRDDPDPSHESQANGALMRVSPLGIWGAGHADADLGALARADAALTHPHPVCTDASAIFAGAIAFAIRTQAPPRAVYEHGRSLAAGTALEAGFGQAPNRMDGPDQGWVRIAINNAFWQLVHAPDVEEAVVGTVRRGGDTDTCAAICGALAGAVYGREALPAQWRDLVLSCRPLPGARHVRPRRFWPVDALELAERLLL